MECSYIHNNDENSGVPSALRNSQLLFPCEGLVDLNNSVQRLDQHRDLGVFLSTDLSWTAHYEKICCNAYRSLYLIRRSFSSALPVNLKRDLYLALVRSQLIYCSQVWRPKLIKEILLLERKQRRATKIILNDYKSDYKSRLNSTRLLPLMYWFELQDIIFLVRTIQ